MEKKELVITLLPDLSLSIRITVIPVQIVRSVPSDDRHRNIEHIVVGELEKGGGGGTSLSSIIQTGPYKKYLKSSALKSGIGCHLGRGLTGSGLNSMGAGSLQLQMLP